MNQRRAGGDGWVGLGSESFAQELDLSGKRDDFRKVITGFIRDAHNCLKEKNCAYVSLRGGKEVGVFYSGFAGKKIDPHGKPVPGQRKQPSHV